ncbi:MAG TPA: SIS domain-containing protein [bacterium]|nr:SIS domain-containing protein [bacterium]
MREKIKENIENLTSYLNDNIEHFTRKIYQICEILWQSYYNNKKIITMGNGGSAADAQHIVCELVGRFLKSQRRPLAAVCLNTNVSTLTAIANDFGYDYVFSRQIEALCEEGDVVIAYSTSGNSENIIEALKIAHSKAAKIITITGKDGGKMKEIGDLNFNIELKDTPRIQEVHCLINHLICELLESRY